MSAQSIYSKGGWPIGWLSEDVIYDSTGEARAFIDDEKVCSYEGQHLGSFHDGYLRDLPGDAVGFLEEAKGGPSLPEIQAKESPPELKDEPERQAFCGADSEATGTDNWSELAFNTFMRGWLPGVTAIGG